MSKRTRIQLELPQFGLRPAADSRVLIKFARVRDGERVAELGSGIGNVTLALVAKYAAEFHGFELQPPLHRLALINRRRNRAALRGGVRFHLLDVRALCVNPQDIAPNAHALPLAVPVPSNCIPHSPSAIPHSALRTPHSPSAVSHSALRDPHLPSAIPHPAPRISHSFRGRFDRVLFNPPWHKQGLHRLPADPVRAIQLHELHGTLLDFVRAAAFLGKPRFSAQLILPAARENDLRSAAQVTKLALRSLRPIRNPQSPKPLWIIATLSRGTAQQPRVLKEYVITGRE